MIVRVRIKALEQPAQDESLCGASLSPYNLQKAQLSEELQP